MIEKGWMDSKKYRFKGHESFVPREGWFTKALKEISLEDGESTFKEYYGADRLGVGPNMAKAIRYWLEAANLINMVAGKARLTEIGKAILEHDLYIEDPFTLWIIHMNLVMNSEKATAWYMFFSEFDMDFFTGEEMKSVMSHLVEMDFAGEKQPSNSSVLADCDAIIQMYAKERDGDIDPEEKKKSPFYSLHLIRSEGENYRKMSPSKNQLDELAVWYGIVQCMEDEDSISIDDLVSKPGSVGKSLNIKRTMLLEYIDALADRKKLTVNKTAGLDMIYVNTKQESKDILNEYYENRR